MIDILIADDEKPLANFLQRGLSAEGYQCATLNELHELLPHLRQQPAQVLILDRMFHQEDSLELLVAIKALPQPPMILMLTALDEVSHRVQGLTQGADDYLCKPFDFDELLARVSALARRNPGAEVSAGKIELLSAGSLQIDREQRIACLFSEELALTKIELDLLIYFVENANRVLTRERILSRVWHTSSDPQTNVVDVYISRLRKKLETDQSLAIETLRGSGYRLKQKTPDA